jgi:two-component system cell cycle sensor histidine kinase/response regulator CckA
VDFSRAENSMDDQKQNLRFPKLSSFIRKRPRVAARLVAVAAFILLIPVALQIDRWILLQSEARARSTVSTQLQLIATNLSQAVNRRMFVVTGLTAFAETQLRQRKTIAPEIFDLFAARLYSNVSGIRNLALAPNGVMTMVYPVTGNERVIGYRPSEDPRPFVRADVTRAIQTKRITVSLPIELIQGGLGIITRQAIFEEGKFWGLANVVVDVSILLKDAGALSDSSEIAIALRDQQEHVFFGAGDVFAAEPELLNVSLPEEHWTLAAVPIGGWASVNATTRGYVRVLGISVLCLLTLVAYLVSFRQMRLSHVVSLRTTELAEANIALTHELAERTRAQRIQATLYEIAHATTQGGSIDDLFRAFHRSIRKIIPAENLCVALYDSVREEISYPYFVHRRHSKPAPHPRGKDLVSYVLTQNSPILMTPFLLDELRGRGIIEEERPLTTGWLGVPLNISGSVIGVLCVCNSDTVSYPFEDLHFLEIVSQQIAIALDRHRSEVAVRHSQKLESLGTLAGGIAHDFNNLLNAILGQSSLALAKLPDGTMGTVNIQKAISAAEKAADLTRQLLAYSGRGSFDSRPINLNTIVRENLQLLSVSVSKTIELQSLLTDDDATVLADPGQMQQVIMNLIINAGEAIGDAPGHVLVETRALSITSPDQYSSIGRIEPGDYVSLRVTDDGCGMSSETTARIFDPFFTTKFTGRGLGLAAVLGIVRSHKGAIRIDSTLNAGTTFEILLPRLGGEPAASSSSNTAFDAGSFPHQQILVIDDDESVLDFVRDALADHNITVLTEQNPFNGVETFRERQKEIDLVLLDLSMPGMDGRETLSRLRAIDPDIRVILTSGYSEVEITSKFQTPHFSAILKKPYTPEALRATIWNVLKAS